MIPPIKLANTTIPIQFHFYPALQQLNNFAVFIQIDIAIGCVQTVTYCEINTINVKENVKYMNFNIM